MKKVLFTLGLVMLLALGAQAQDPAKKTNFYLGAGLGLPMGDFGDAFGMGLHGAGALGFNISPSFQPRAKVEFHTFGSDIDGVDGSLNILMFGGDGRFSFAKEGQKLAPFLLGGLGFASSKFEDFSSTDFYFEFGGGVDIVSNGAMSWFLQGRYVSISGDGGSDAFIPVTVGLRF